MQTKYNSYQKLFQLNKKFSVTRYNILYDGAYYIDV